MEEHGSLYTGLFEPNGGASPVRDASTGRSFSEPNGGASPVRDASMGRSFSEPGFFDSMGVHLGKGMNMPGAGGAGLAGVGGCSYLTAPLG